MSLKLLQCECSFCKQSRRFRQRKGDTRTRKELLQEIAALKEALAAQTSASTPDFAR